MMPGDAKKRERYWLTPPELYAKLDADHAFDFDPCPYPLPDGFNSLYLPWGKSNYVNPPFHRDDGINGKGPTAFVRKAIEEAKQGNKTVMVIPVQNYVALLLEAGAKLSSLGRVRWLHVETGKPIPSPSPTLLAVIGQ